MSIYAFIDGFNIYHLIDNHAQQTGENLKWLSYPDLVSLIAEETAQPDNLYFFTAQPNHLGYDKITRHQIYCKSQRLLGVNVIQGRFKKSDMKCKAHRCGQYLFYPINQEKQTDVNIALTLMETAFRVQQGRFYLFTADTDQVPTARIIQKLFPKIQFYWVYPRRDKIPDEIRQVLRPKQIINLNWQHFRSSQMPETVTSKGDSVQSPYARQGVK